MAPFDQGPSPRRLRPSLWSGAACVLVIAAVCASPVLADPKPGSTGVVGPPLPKKAAATATKASPAGSATAAKKSSKAVKVARVSGLTNGSKGAAVISLQTKLAALKYDISDTSGIFGDQTYHAVMAFQKVTGLSRSGVAGAQTVAALETATDPAPLLAAGGDNRIEVDLDRQVLMLYKGGALFRILSISSGSGKDFCVTDPETGKQGCDKAVTPGGSFRVSRRWIGWRESKLGLMYNPLYFNGGIAIHGAPSVPGYAASHGCVRIPMISAEWFPNEVSNGTAVYVFGAEKGPVPLGAKAPTENQTGTPTSSTVPGITTAPTSTVVRLLTPSTVATVPSITTVPAPTVPPATLAPVPTQAPVVLAPTQSTTTAPVPSTTTTTVAVPPSVP